MQENVTLVFFGGPERKKTNFGHFKLLDILRKKRKIDSFSFKTVPGQYNWLKCVEILPTRLPKVISSEKSKFGHFKLLDIMHKKTENWIIHSQN